MYEDIKKEIVEVCRKLWQKGFVAANDGNITVKVAENRYLATETGISKADITLDNIGLIDDKLSIIEGREGWKPSSEVKMHLRCYKERSDIGAVVHAHPPVCTGFACAHIPLDDYCMIESVLMTGSVPISPYATPSTDEVPESIAPFLENHDCILLQNHGALTVGNNLTAAYHKMESLEHQAHISLVARLLGGAKDIDRENIDRLIAMREQYGITGRHPGYKKYH